MTINEKLEKFDNKLDIIIEQIGNIKSELNRQHHDLYDNGKKGIITKVEELENKTEKHDRIFYSLSFLILTFQFLGIKLFTNK